MDIREMISLCWNNKNYKNSSTGCWCEFRIQSEPYCYFMRAPYRWDISEIKQRMGKAVDSTEPENKDSMNPDLLGFSLMSDHEVAENIRRLQEKYIALSVNINLFFTELGGALQRLKERIDSFSTKGNKEE